MRAAAPLLRALGPSLLLTLPSLALPSLTLGGCALPALINDKVLGPVSPAGRLQAATVGSNFRVTDEGVTGEVDPDEALLRAFPRDFMARVAKPEAFWFIIKGLQAGVAGFSPVVLRDRRVGRPLGEAELDLLREADATPPRGAAPRWRAPAGAAERYATPLSPWWDGVALRYEAELLRVPPPRPRRTLSAEEVVRRFGPPQRWIRRRQGSLMTYRAEVARWVSLYAGVPPLAGRFAPVPGLDNLRFRYTRAWHRPAKAILFFDRQDRLRSWAHETAEEERR